MTWSIQNQTAMTTRAAELGEGIALLTCIVVGGEEGSLQAHEQSRNTEYAVHCRSVACYARKVLICYGLGAYGFAAEASLGQRTVRFGSLSALVRLARATREAKPVRF